MTELVLLLPNSDRLQQIKKKMSELVLLLTHSDRLQQVENYARCYS